MAYNKQYVDSLKAISIAKVFISSSGLLSTNLLLENEELDFITFSKNNPTLKIGFEIKATRYGKKDLERKFELTISKLRKIGFPVILMFINPDTEKGYFEIVDSSQQNRNIEQLQLTNFIERIRQLIQ